MPKAVKNRGIRHGRRPTDYVAGTAASLAYEEVLPSGNWFDDLPTGEVQYGVNGDKMNCVTHSFHNSLETQADLFIRTGKMPQTHLNFLQSNGYIDSNGKVNFNDRIAAILNGTTPLGNWQYAVADSGRTLGLFPQSCLENDENLTWSSYYNAALITPKMVEFASESKMYFEVKYEWVNTDRNSLLRELKQAPIQVTIPGHAVVNISGTTALSKYFDTYPPFVKDWSNPFDSAMKIILIIKSLDMPVTPIIKNIAASDEQYLPSLVPGKEPIRIQNQQLLHTLIDRGYVAGTAVPEFVLPGATVLSINDES